MTPWAATLTAPCPGDDGACGIALTVEVEVAPDGTLSVLTIEGCDHADAIEADAAFAALVRLDLEDAA